MQHYFVKSLIQREPKTEKENLSLISPDSPLSEIARRPAFFALLAFVYRHSIATHLAYDGWFVNAFLEEILRQMRADGRVSHVCLKRQIIALRSRNWAEIGFVGAFLEGSIE